MIVRHGAAGAPASGGERREELVGATGEVIEDVEGEGGRGCTARTGGCAARHRCRADSACASTGSDGLSLRGAGTPANERGERHDYGASSGLSC